MGLLLICPYCQAKIPLSSCNCPACRGELRNLSPENRHYFLGRETGVAAAPLNLEPPPAPVTVAIEESVDFQEQMPSAPGLESKEVSLCEALDRILNKGAVLYGEVMISVAGIDLVYLGLQVILASMETARGFRPVPAEALVTPNLFEKRTR